MAVGSKDAAPGSGDALISAMALQEVSRNARYLLPGLGFLPVPFPKGMLRLGR